MSEAATVLPAWIAQLVTSRHPETQLAPSVMYDIISELYNKSLTKPSPSLLVFGLGFNTPTWVEACARCNATVQIVEENVEFIRRNPGVDVLHIPPAAWGTTVGQGLSSRVPAVPEKLLRASPFDIILVDGPTGYAPTCPGRQTSIQWASALASRDGGIVYVDDFSRPIEQAASVQYLLPVAKQPPQQWKERLHTLKVRV